MLYHAGGQRHRSRRPVERLAPELEEAQPTRVAVEGDVARAQNAWNRALVDVLVFRSRHVRSRIW
jgi:hypothetical protein